MEQVWGHMYRKCRHFYRKCRHVYQNPSVWIFLEAAWVLSGSYKCQYWISRAGSWLNTNQRALSVRDFDTLCVRKGSCFKRNRIGRVTEARHLYVVVVTATRAFVTFTAVFCVWGTRCAGLKEGDAVSGNGALRKMFGLYWGTGEDCITRSFVIFYCWTNVNLIVRSRIMKWAGYVARVEKKRNAYRVLVENP
jgi:hypothetical protein